MKIKHVPGRKALRICCIVCVLNTLAVLLLHYLLQLPVRPYLGKGPTMKGKQKAIKGTGNIQAERKRLQGDRTIILKNAKPATKKTFGVAQHFPEGKIRANRKELRG